MPWQAIARDLGRCIITRNPDCEVCHIIPFWSLGRPHSIWALLSNSESLFGCEAVTDFQDNFATRLLTGERGSLDIVDKFCNMICLSRQLHRAWEKGLFALEPMGHCRRERGAGDSLKDLDGKLLALDLDDETVDDLKKQRLDVDLHELEKAEEGEMFSKGKPLLKENIDESCEYGIILRLPWVPATTLKDLRDPRPLSNTNPLDIFKPADAFVSQFHIASVLPIDNGHFIRIWSKNPGKLPDWGALQLRWTAQRINRLSGGADPETYNPCWDDFAENWGFQVPGDGEYLVQELVEITWDAANRTT